MSDSKSTSAKNIRKYLHLKLIDLLFKLEQTKSESLAVFFYRKRKRPNTPFSLSIEKTYTEISYE